MPEERIRLVRQRIQSETNRLPVPLQEHPHALDSVESIAEHLYNEAPVRRGQIAVAGRSAPGRARTGPGARRVSTMSIQNVALLELMKERLD